MRPSWALRPSPSRRKPSIRLATLALGLLSCIQTAFAASSSDYFVHSLPGAPEGPLRKMHAGHVQTDPEHNGGLFFWHFGNRHIGDRQRTVIWLNGGPGCSSMDGALMEIGPYRVREGGKLAYNEGSWDEFANLLFVDNPVGTGFSYVDSNAFLHELQEMANQFIIFLEEWFTMFPEYMHDDLYIAGESYAGQHIPYIADAILKRNTNAARPWNLKGLLIGNGWISPADQYPSYSAFAYKSNLIETGSEQSDRVEDKQLKCHRTMDALPGGRNGVGQVSIGDCEAILQTILEETRHLKGDKDQQCINMYDTRLRDSYPSCGMNWPPDLAAVTPYLRDPDVIRALNIDPAKKSTGWQECVGQVSSAFRATQSAPSISLLPNLLTQVPILLFSGADDLICNHIGTEALIDNLSWNGGKGFETSGVMAPRREWTFEGEKAGMWQEARNLTYVLFYESSHMVPFDHPRRTRDMLDRFMGVDIASVGGPPADSRIGGKKGVETSVGGHPNSTVAEAESEEKLEQAKWDAYYRSGEVVLIIVIILAGTWGWYVWRDRRSRSGYGRVAISGSDGALDTVLDGVRDVGRGAMRMEQYRHEPRSPAGQRDLEAADFDEGEVDAMERRRRDMLAERYSVGSASSDDDDDDPAAAAAAADKRKGKGKTVPNGK